MAMIPTPAPLSKAAMLMMRSMIVITCHVLVVDALLPLGSNGRTLRRPPTSQLSVFNIATEGLEQMSTQDFLDGILDECLRTSGRRPIMFQFEPSSKVIWSHYKGTVFAETWRPAVRQILWAMAVYLILRRKPTFQSNLSDLSSMYTQLLSVTIFTLTFFVNQSYTIWRTCLTTCRVLQGRLNDLIMALAGFAKRIDPRDSTDSSVFAPKSRRILSITARYIRLFNILSYASLARSHRPLLTPQGMRRMVARGLMTAKERRVLLSAQIPATQRHNAVLMWILRIVIEGRKAGHFDGGFGFEQQMMAKTQEIRAQGNSMNSVLKGRMPFAYAHFVQILVDAVLWLYPVVACTRKASLSMCVVGSGLITICYQGLFDLAKRFLDPFHNENFWRGDDALIVDTLIAETNAGSMRWMFCLDEMPISYSRINKGDLEDFILPDEGFTRDQAETRRQKDAEMEALKLSTEERQERMAEAIETAEVEFEETKRILEAPPGSDFVPGIDDDESDHDGGSDGLDTGDDDDFLEAAGDELLDAIIEKSQSL